MALPSKSSGTLPAMCGSVSGSRIFGQKQMTTSSLCSITIILMTIPWLVQCETCGPLDHHPDTTLDFDSENVEFLAEIEDTTQHYCYTACCSMLHTDGCNMAVFDKSNKTCTLVSCEDEGCNPIPKDGSKTTTIGLYNETTSTALPTTAIATTLEDSVASTASVTNTSNSILNVETVTTSVKTNINENETTLKATEKSTNAAINSALITTLSTISDEDSRPMDTNTDGITPPGPHGSESQNTSNKPDVTTTRQEQISSNASSVNLDDTTQVPITSISHPPTSTSPDGSNQSITIPTTASVNESSAPTTNITSNSSTNITTTITNTTTTETSESNSSEYLQTTTSIALITDASTSSESNISTTTESVTQSDIAETTVSENTSVNVSNESTSANITSMTSEANQTATNITTTSNVTTEGTETTTNVASVVMSTKTYTNETPTTNNISTTLGEQQTVNVTTTPPSTYNSATSTIIIESSTANKDTANITGSQLNSTFMQPKKHFFASPDDQLPALLVAALSIGIVFIFVIFVLLGKRVFDSWQRRHYSRVDYLINGMYN